jgi:Kdo2-lipid IVA lauroyltransferase/acyltransferase
MRKLIQWSVAFVVRVTLWLVMMTPAFISYSCATLIACLLTPILYWKGPRTAPNRTSLRRNFQIAFGAELSEKQIKQLTFKVLRHLAWLVIDFARMPLFREKALAEAVSEEDRALLLEVLAEGKGVLGVGGHVGVFGLLGHIACGVGLPICTVSNPNRNPYLQKVLRHRQEGPGQENIDNRHVARQLMRVLRDGKYVGMLVDENAKHSNLFLPFLGTLASVNPSLAKFHLKTGAPIIVSVAFRTRPGHYRFEILDVIREESTGDKAADQRRVMARVIEQIERSIRMAPEQWFWNSKRWKARPPDEILGANGLPPRSVTPIPPEFNKLI